MGGDCFIMGGETGRDMRDANGAHPMLEVLGTIVGAMSGLLLKSSVLGLMADSLGEDHDLGGDEGLSEEELKGDTSVEREGGADGAPEEDEDFFVGEPPRDCCMRQWILNQFDLRPYLDPDFDMPTIRHLRSRQALQAVRFFLSTTHR